MERLKKKSYKPQSARLVEIAKDNGKTRPLSIYCYEDKLVQDALRRVLEAVFEPHFYDGMMGFRPGRGCHKAIQKLNVMLERRPTNYVLVWWFEGCIRPILKGYGGLVAYADDFVACFQYKEDAEMFYGRLKNRMEHFGMSLEEEKTRLIEFGRYAQERCGKNGKKPETKKYAKKCKEVHRLIKGMRIKPVEEIIKKHNQILVGYYHYYGITDNSKSISGFRYCVMRSLYHWRNRRSQKKSYTWEGFNEMLKQYPLASPKIYVSVYAG